jgi:hypothetical protein
MTLSVAQVYSLLSANLQKVQQGLIQLEKETRDAIAADDNDRIILFTHLFALLSGAFAECKFKQLLFDQNVLSGADRNRILFIDATRDRPHLQRWHALANLVLRKYKAPGSGRIDDELKAKITKLKQILDQDLEPLISLRNPVAHGSWQHVLNLRKCEIDPAATARLKDNFLVLYYKQRLISAMAEMAHSIVLQKRDFRKEVAYHSNRIDQIHRDLSTKSYEKYAADLRGRRVSHLSIISKMSTEVFHSVRTSR